MEEREKKEKLENDRYKKLKLKQKEKQKNFHQKLQNEIDGSRGSMGNLLNMTNDIEQNNKSIHSKENLALKDI